MRLLKYLFLFIALLFTSKTFASCPHPATFNAISSKPFPPTFCYPESGGGSGFCEFQTFDNGFDIEVPCTNPSGCGSSPRYAIDVKSTSNKVYKNSDCTNPPLQEGCYQDFNGSIICDEEEEENNDPVLDCTADSCLNPENKRCPTGYTTGSFNDQAMCVKTNTPDPDPNPNPCVDCLTPDKDVVTAVNDANSSITNSVNNMKNTVSDFLSQISDKISILTDKIQNLSTSNNNNNNTGTGSETVDTSSLNATVPETSLEQRYVKTDIFSSNSQCPQDNTLSLDFAGSNVSYTFSYARICDFLDMFSYLVMIIAYLYSAYIVSKA